MSQEIPTHKLTFTAGLPFLTLMSLDKKNQYDDSVPHRHGYYEIFLFTEGEGSHEIDFKAYDIKPNVAHFVNPGQVHHVKRSPDSEGHLLMFNKEFLLGSSVLKNMLQNQTSLSGFNHYPVIQLKESTYKLLIDLIYQMHNEIKNNGQHCQDVLSSYLHIFVSNCFRERQEFVRKINENAVINQLALLVESNIVTKRKTSFYAESLGVSGKTLNKLVKQNFGKTAQEFIAERAVIEIKRLLTYTDNSVKEIAYLMNFTDAAHLSNFFKKFTNISPNQFRTNSRIRIQ